MSQSERRILKWVTALFEKAILEQMETKNRVSYFGFNANLSRSTVHPDSRSSFCLSNIWTGIIPNLCVKVRFEAGPNLGLLLLIGRGGANSKRWTGQAIDSGKFGHLSLSIKSHFGSKTWYLYRKQSAQTRAISAAARWHISRSLTELVKSCQATKNALFYAFRKFRHCWEITSTAYDDLITWCPQSGP